MHPSGCMRSKDRAQVLMLARQTRKIVMEVHNHNQRTLLNSFCELGGSHQGLDNWLSMYLCPI